MMLHRPAFRLGVAGFKKANFEIDNIKHIHQLKSIRKDSYT